MTTLAGNKDKLEVLYEVFVLLEFCVSNGWLGKSGRREPTTDISDARRDRLRPRG